MIFELKKQIKEITYDNILVLNENDSPLKPSDIKPLLKVKIKGASFADEKIITVNWTQASLSILPDTINITSAKNVANFTNKVISELSKIVDGINKFIKVLNEDGSNLKSNASDIKPLLKVKIKGSTSTDFADEKIITVNWTQVSLDTLPSNINVTSIKEYIGFKDKIITKLNQQNKLITKSNIEITNENGFDIFDNDIKLAWIVKLNGTVINKKTLC